MPRATTRQTESEPLHAKLRDAGLRVTAARVAVLEALVAASGPMSHAELVERLGGRAGDPATVFRNLATLTDADLAVRTDLGDRVWRFAAKSSHQTEGHEHPHFLCSECGVVECMPNIEVRARAGQRVPRSVSNHAAQVQLKGVCDVCASV